MHITTLFIWFILYSVLGWIYETIYCSVKELAWNNRGMLNGPYCPIYGVGAVLDVLICSHLPDPGAVFLTCVFGSALLEYTTSYVTEKLFHAVWWDYSDMPLNINGRICVPGSLTFGVAGLLVLYVLQPCMALITNSIPLYGQEFLAMMFVAFFSADCVLTADSLIALNTKLDAAMKALDAQIAEKYSAFIENTKQNLCEGLNSLKEKISFEEFLEKRTDEELNHTLSTMNWKQMRLLRSSVSFRKVRYSDFGNKMRHMLSFGRKNKEDTEWKQE